MCIFKKGNNILTLAIIVLGVLSIIVGLIMNTQLEESQHTLSRFAGMISGFGSGITMVAVVGTIIKKFSSEEKNKEREIKLNDERNVTLTQISFTAAAISSYVLLIIMAFTFCFKGFWFGTIFATACMYVEAIVAVVTYKIMSTRM